MTRNSSIAYKLALGSTGIGAGLFICLQKAKINLLQEHFIQQQKQLVAPRGAFGFSRALADQSLAAPPS